MPEPTTDLERLRAWMAQHDHTIKTLAQALDIKYMTLYMMLEHNKHISDRFITTFIRYYGCDEALRVFHDRLIMQTPS
jgi:plasmid maintenance system antidote protein VapI